MGGTGMFSNLSSIFRGAKKVEPSAIDPLSTTGPGPLLYQALMAQAGLGDLTVIVLNNTLGGTVVWTRTSLGAYRGTLAGAFPENQCIIRCRPNKDNSTVFEFYAQWESEDYIAFYSDGGDDVGMSNIWFEVMVF